MRPLNMYVRMSRLNMAQHVAYGNIEVESSIHRTTQHVACEDIKAEPSTFQTSQRPGCENIRAESHTFQTSQHSGCENIKAEPTACCTAQNSACENIKTESTSYQITRHAARENIEAEPPAFQTAPLPRCRNVKTEATVCSAEGCEKWRDVGNFTVTPIPGVYILASRLPQESQASSPSSVCPERKPATDWCEADSVTELTDERKQVTSCPASNKSESRQRPSPHNTAAMKSHRDTAPRTISMVRVAAPHRCQLCPSMFMQHSNLGIHMVACHSQKWPTHESQSSSPDCGHNRQSARDVEQKPGVAISHVCDVCSRAFSQADDLKTHKLMHTAYKPFVCKVCSKAFTSASALKTHADPHR